mgnify:CR=1 FL=1
MTISVVWGPVGNLFGGKGWNIGSYTKYAPLPSIPLSTQLTNLLSSPVRYQGAWSVVPSPTPDSQAYLSVYGWVKGSPWIEYYIVENWATFHPLSQPGVTYTGTITSDGSPYDLGFENYIGIPRTPSGSGTPVPIRRLWSVRKAKRTGGVVTVANHWAAWATSGPIGTAHEWEIVSVEAFNSTGKANITVF